MKPRAIRKKSDWDAFEAKKFPKFRLFLADIFKDVEDRFERFKKKPTPQESTALFGVTLRGITLTPALNETTERGQRSHEKKQLRDLRRWKLASEESSKESEDDATHIPCTTFYRYFRILVVGRNSVTTSTNCALSLCGLELFGT